MIDIIFFAIIAIILVVKLRSILGKECDDNENQQEKSRQNRSTVVDITGEVIRNKHETKNQSTEITVMQHYRYTPKDNNSIIIESAVSAFNELKSKIDNIDEKVFVQNCAECFAITINSYNHGEIENIKNITSPELFNNFSQAIKQKGVEGKKENLILVKINDVTIIHSDIVKDIGEIKVRFISQQIHYISDESNKIVEGNNALPYEVSDTWVFGRDINDKNAQWVVLRIESAE